MAKQKKPEKPASHYQFLNIEVSNRIIVIILSNPPANSLRIALLRELDDALQNIFLSAEIKVIIITGRGRNFACGADIREMSACKTATEAGEMSKFGQNVFKKIENSPKPVIAAINGFCLGGGLELAMSCHIRIASDKAIMGMPEISLGMIPAFGGSYRLQKLVGKGVAIQMILSGEKILADKAHSIGLVQKVVSSEAVMKEIKILAVKLAEKSSVSMRMALHSITQGSENPCHRAMEIESDCIQELYESHDLKEGVFAFLEKRRPVFLDR